MIYMNHIKRISSGIRAYALSIPLDSSHFSRLSTYRFPHYAIVAMQTYCASKNIFYTQIHITTYLYLPQVQNYKYPLPTRKTYFTHFYFQLCCKQKVSSGHTNHVNMISTPGVNVNVVFDVFNRHRNRLCDVNSLRSHDNSRNNSDEKK